MFVIMNKWGRYFFYFSLVCNDLGLGLKVVHLRTWECDRYSIFCWCKVIRFLSSKE